MARTSALQKIIKSKIRAKLKDEIKALRAAYAEKLAEVDNLDGVELLGYAIGVLTPSFDGLAASTPSQAPAVRQVPQPSPVAPVERVPLQPPSDGFVDPPPGDNDFVRIVPSRMPRGSTMISGLGDPPPDMSNMVMVAPATRDFPATYMPR
jgi:hypothetical protein